MMSEENLPDPKKVPKMPRVEEPGKETVEITARQVERIRIIFAEMFGIIIGADTSERAEDFVSKLGNELLDILEYGAAQELF